MNGWLLCSAIPILLILINSLNVWYNYHFLSHRHRLLSDSSLYIHIPSTHISTYTTLLGNLGNKRPVVIDNGRLVDGLDPYFLFTRFPIYPRFSLANQPLRTPLNECVRNR